MGSTWGFATAGEIVFGSGSAEKVGRIVSRLGARQALVITDKTIIDAGAVPPVLASLNKAGLRVEVFSGGVPEPTLGVLDESLDFARGREVDAIVAVGGGSAIDLAKGTALLLRHGGEAADYFGEYKVPGPVVPVVAVSTTSGTSAELSAVAVFTLEEENLKVGISDNHLRPRVAVFDPLLTLTLPPTVTAHSGVDALCHAIESYIALDYAFVRAPTEEVIYHGRFPLSQHLAEKAISLIGANLRLAYDQGSNLDAREGMALANVVAGMAYTNSGVTVNHALAYPIGGITHAPHGLVNGLLLPHVLEFNLPVRVRELGRVAELLGEELTGMSPWEAARAGIAAVVRLLKDVGFPAGLREIGVHEEDLPAIAESTLRIERVIRCNPRRIDAQRLLDLLQQAI